MTKPVDGNASRNCLVSCQAHIPAVIVVAVSWHVDRMPLGVERRAPELGQGKIDSTADGRAISKRTRDFQQLIPELLGGGQIFDQCPIDHEALWARAGPFDEADRNSPTQSRSNGVDDVWITECGGISFPLQLELICINAARYIGSKHEQEIDRFFRLNVRVPSR